MALCFSFAARRSARSNKPWLGRHLLLAAALGAALLAAAPAAHARDVPDNTEGSAGTAAQGVLVVDSAPGGNAAVRAAEEKPGVEPQRLVTPGEGEAGGVVEPAGKDAAAKASSTCRYTVVNKCTNRKPIWISWGYGYTSSGTFGWYSDGYYQIPYGSSRYFQVDVSLAYMYIRGINSNKKVLAMLGSSVGTYDYEYGAFCTATKNAFRIFIAQDDDSDVRLFRYADFNSPTPEYYYSCQDIASDTQYLSYTKIPLSQCGVTFTKTQCD